jgi:hypothetical protein
MDTKEHTKLVIKNIPYKYSREEVETLIVQKLGTNYGTVLHSVEAIPNRQTTNKGYAFVYGTPELARAKQELAGWVLGGKPLQLLLGDEKGDGKATKWRTGDNPDEDVEQVMQQSIGLLLAARTKRMEKDAVGNVLSKQKVHIKGGVRKVTKWAKRHYKGGLSEYLKKVSDPTVARDGIV